MAVAPLFVASMDAVRARLRLSGVADASDAMDAIDEAVRVVRTNIYARLGLTRVGELVGYSSTDTPTTENEILRTVAEGMEVKWVRYELLGTLPVLFMDGSGQREQAWNDEGAFRPGGPAGAEGERRRLMAEIDRALDLLSGTSTIGGQTTVRASSIAPPCTRPWPGHSASPLWDEECC